MHIQILVFDFSLFFCFVTKEPKRQGLQKALVAHAITFFINSCRRWFLFAPHSLAHKPTLLK